MLWALVYVYYFQFVLQFLDYSFYHPLCKSIISHGTHYYEMYPDSLRRLTQNSDDIIK